MFNPATPLDYLDHARRLVPDNPDVGKLAGWAYYGMNKLDQAVAEWKHALALRPDKELQAALEKVPLDRVANVADSPANQIRTLPT